MSDEKEIVVFAEKSDVPKFSWKLKIQIMAAGTTEPAELREDFSGIEVDEPEVVVEEVAIPLPSPWSRTTKTAIAFLLIMTASGIVVTCYMAWKNIISQHF